MKIDEKTSATIYRIIAEPPPPGHTRWSTATLTDEVISRGLIPSIPSGAVRRHLMKREREYGMPYPIPRGRTCAKNRPAPATS